LLVLSIQANDDALNLHDCIENYLLLESLLVPTQPDALPQMWICCYIRKLPCLGSLPIETEASSTPYYERQKFKAN